jgi:medium-chain acyl-[acyl-carrier-protein] hydrolase
MNPWLPYRKARPKARLRLFCFPHAGAGASSFRGWAEALPRDIEVCALQYPGHETRFNDPLFSSVEELAGAIVEAINSELTGPFAFFGHSMGALVAYESARILRSRGGPQPRRVLVSGRGAPHLPLPMAPAHNLPEPELMAALRRYSNRADELLAHPDLLSVFLPILRADLAAAETYRPDSFDPLLMPLTCLGGLGDIDVPWYRLSAWASHTLGALRVWMFPGGHFYLHPPTQPLMDSITSELNSSGPGRIELLPGTVHVWKIKLDPSDQDTARLKGILSAEERERARRFPRAAERRQFLVSQAALRTILGRVLDRAPQSLQFGSGAHGKPFLQGEELSFNLSHSGDLALVAVTREGPVGIDIERVRADLDWTAMSRHPLSPHEQSALAGLPPEHRLTGFFSFWTRKEAQLKATGLGAAAPADNLLDFPPTLLLPQVGEFHDGRTRADVHPEPGYVGSLVVEGCCTHFRMESWDSTLLE